MYILLISIVWGLFAAILFLNIYIRVKAFKYYKKLVQARVDFSTTHIFNEAKMAAEVYPKYPQHVADIQAFTGHIRKSIRIGIILMVLITVFGAILMYYRHS